jgi:hypothetical protein
MTEVRQKYENVRFIRHADNSKKGEKMVLLECMLCNREYKLPTSRWKCSPPSRCKGCNVNKRKKMISQSMAIGRAMR